MLKCQVKVWNSLFHLKKLRLQGPPSGSGEELQAQGLRRTGEFQVCRFPAPVLVLYLLGLVDEGADEVLHVLALVPLEVYLCLGGSEAAGSLGPAELEHGGLLVRHHGEVSPGGELGRGVPLRAQVPIGRALAPVLRARDPRRALRDVADLKRGQEIELALLGQHAPVLRLPGLQERVRGEARGLVVAELERGHLAPRVLHLLQSRGQLPQRLARGERRGAHAVRAQHHPRARLRLEQQPI